MNSKAPFYLQALQLKLSRSPFVSTEPYKWKFGRIFYVYILECADGSYYTGFTNNIIRRLSEHRRGCNEKSYTFTRRPVGLVYAEQFYSPLAGIKREKQIKNWSRSKKTALINSEFNLLHELAKCRNSSSHEFYTMKKAA